MRTNFYTNFGYSFDWAMCCNVWPVVAFGRPERSIYLLPFNARYSAYHSDIILTSSKKSDCEHLTSYGHDFQECPTAYK